MRLSLTMALLLSPFLLGTFASGQDAPANKGEARRPIWPSSRDAKERERVPTRRVVFLQDEPYPLPPLPDAERDERSRFDMPESARVGEPTLSTAEEESSTPQAEQVAPTPLLLTKALGLQDSRFRIFGWIQNSFTGNTNGTPSDRINFGVFPNTLANTWMGNQYYTVFEAPLKLTDQVDFGARFDFLFGNDWQFTKMYGLFDRAFVPYQFAGIDLPQFYAEVHLPVLTPGGLDIKGGRFANPGGYESFMAINRPLLSVPYMYNFTPFTFFGMLATWHVTDRVNLYSGTVNGMDRWINSNYIWNYFGGMTLKSSDDKTTLNFYGLTGPNQLPRFAPAGYPLVPVATPPPGFRARQVNPLYAESYRAYLSLTLVRDWTEKLTEVLETEVVWDPRSLGFGPGVRTLYYQGLGHWLLYKVTEKATAVWRAEMFWDPNGAATGIHNNYFEMTAGIQYRPRDWLWFRPEIRYDTSFPNPAYNDQTVRNQLTLGFDVILLW